MAEGFLRIAVENMANAIKKISVQRGYDVTEYTLNCFGGAGGQHACLVADALGMTKVFLHPFAGVLSAYGMGLADVRAIRERQVEAAFAAPVLAEIEAAFEELAVGCQGRGPGPGRGARAHRPWCARSSSATKAPTAPLQIDFADLGAMQGGLREGAQAAFRLHRPGPQAGGGGGLGGKPSAPPRRWPIPSGPCLPDAVAAEPLDRGGPCIATAKPTTRPSTIARPCCPARRWMAPAVIIEATGTTVVEPGWQAEMSPRGHLVLTRVVARPQKPRPSAPRPTR